MQVCLWIITGVFLVGAAGGTYEFMVVRRCRLSLWLVANTCSVLMLLFAIAAIIGSKPAMFALAAVLFIYGVEGLFIFGWRRHPHILVPQFLHVVMASTSVLLFAQAPSPRHAAMWAVGLLAGFGIRSAQRHALRTRTDTAGLAQDPIIGSVFARLTQTSPAKDDSEETT